MICSPCAAMGESLAYERGDDGGELRGVWAGSSVEFEIDTTTDSPSLTFDSLSNPENVQVSVQMRYLESYERMGGADVTCTGGCTCAALHIEATINQQWSVPEAVEFVVSQSATCVVRLVTTSSPKGAKFKIMSLAVMVKEKDEAGARKKEVAV